MKFKNEDRITDLVLQIPLEIWMNGLIFIESISGGQDVAVASEIATGRINSFRLSLAGGSLQMWKYSIANEKISKLCDRINKEIKDMQEKQEDKIYEVLFENVGNNFKDFR